MSEQEACKHPLYDGCRNRTPRDELLAIGDFLCEHTSTRVALKDHMKENVRVCRVA